METKYQQFKIGQKVRNQFGETLTVHFQDGCVVHVEEELGHYHPANLFPFEEGNTNTWNDPTWRDGV
jgi:hypothetical protein